VTLIGSGPVMPDDGACLPGDRALGARYDASRIYLRPLEEADIDDRYVAWFADSTVTRYLASRNFTAAESKTYLRAGRESRRYFLYAVCLKETDAHIGNVQIGPVNWAHGVADLVTVIGDKVFWGRGFAAEAIRLGSRVAFEVYGIRKLHGAILADNTGSIKAYTRGGWTIEGRLRDHHLVDGVPMATVLVSCFNDGPSTLPAAT
jgi:RimJ/RimL family protein N-acetyltransferase